MTKVFVEMFYLESFFLWSECCISLPLCDANTWLNSSMLLLETTIQSYSVKFHYDLTHTMEPSTERKFRKTSQNPKYSQIITIIVHKYIWNIVDSLTFCIVYCCFLKEECCCLLYSYYFDICHLYQSYFCLSCSGRSQGSLFSVWESMWVCLFLSIGWWWQDYMPVCLPWGCL